MQVERLNEPLSDREVQVGAAHAGQAFQAFGCEGTEEVLLVYAMSSPQHELVLRTQVLYPSAFASLVKAGPDGLSNLRQFWVATGVLLGGLVGAFAVTLFDWLIGKF